MACHCCRFASAAVLLAVVGAVALGQAQPDKKAAPSAPAAAQPDHKMAPPPGMTDADMKACMDAATPGPMHAWLAKGTGVWAGKCKMWMSPGSEPSMSECVSTITSVMDGKFLKNETTGEMPGMGPFTGMGINGFDNVSQKFQMTWIDSFGTGMMTGTGELSSDQKTVTWTCTANCPIQKKSVAFRQVEKFTGADTMTLEMFGPDPKTGKEFKMMEIAYTRKPGTGPAPAKSASAATPEK